MRKRHALYLSEAMTQRLQLVAETHRVSKSQILERALQRHLTTDENALPSDLSALQQETNARSLRRLERDVAIVTELMATFVRYFVTITPPLPASEHDAARALGQLRFDRVIEDVARRLKTDRSLVARVMAAIGGANVEVNATAGHRQKAGGVASSTTKNAAAEVMEPPKGNRTEKHNG